MENPMEKLNYQAVNESLKGSDPYRKIFSGHNYDENIIKANSETLKQTVEKAKMQLSEMPGTQGGLKAKLLKSLDNSEIMAQVFEELGWNRLDTLASLAENENIMPNKLINALQSQENVKRFLN